MAVLPPIDLKNETGVDGNSTRVLIRLKGLQSVAPPMMFGRYNHVLQKWFVEGAHGDFKVVKWWYLPTESEGVDCA